MLEYIEGNIFDSPAQVIVNPVNTVDVMGKGIALEFKKRYPDMFLLNDDSPFVRVHDDGQVIVYGSPWSGKTPCYRQENYPLRAMVRLSQAPFNRISALPPLQAIGALLPSAPPAFNYVEETSDMVCEFVSDVVSSASFYHLECLPDTAAAELTYSTVFGDVR